jgi:uncharacterized protein (DUF302 family)
VASPSYGFGKTLNTPFADVLLRTRQALQDEGFGVLTEIDVQATLRDKLGLETTPYVILGACNPRFASQVLVAEPEIGLLLPCNVIVYSTAEGTRVSALDPEAVIGLTGIEALGEMAAEVKSRLRRAVEQL